MLLFYLPLGVLLPALLLGHLAAAGDAGLVGVGTSAVRELRGVVVGLLAAVCIAGFPLAPFLAEPEGRRAAHRLFALLLIASLAEVMLFLGLLGNLAVRWLRAVASGPRSALAGAVLVSCLAFGSFHLTYPAPWNTVGNAAFLSGVWVGVALIFFATRSVLGAVVFNNGMALVGFLQRSLDLPGTTAEGWLRAGLALLLAATIVVVGCRRRAASSS